MNVGSIVVAVPKLCTESMTADNMFLQRERHALLFEIWSYWLRAALFEELPSMTLSL